MVNHAESPPLSFGRPTEIQPKSPRDLTLVAPLNDTHFTQAGGVQHINFLNPSASRPLRLLPEKVPLTARQYCQVSTTLIAIPLWEMVPANKPE